MKKNAKKKFILLPALAAAGLGISTMALANNTVTNQPTTYAPAASDPIATAGIISAVNNLSKKVVALGFAGMTAFDQAMYQYDSNLLDTLNANNAGVAVDTANAQEAGTQTDSYIAQTFGNIPANALSTGSTDVNSQAISDALSAQTNLVNNLTLGVPASDTIYINNYTSAISANEITHNEIQNFYNSSTPYTDAFTKLNDDSYFSVASLLEPSAYSQSTQASVNAYMDYLTKSYENPAAAINYNDLKSYLNSNKSKAAQNLYNFLKSSQYQNFQLALRSNMAAKSIAIYNLNKLRAERTPSKETVSGIYTPDGKTAISNPSPLQVEQYQDLHRVEDPAWIASLQQQSSTTLQREIAVELAQIIKQNYQSHMDNERMLATLSAIELQGTQGNSMIMNTLAQQVNQEINDLQNNGKGNNNNNSSNGNNDNSQNQNPSAAYKKYEEQQKNQGKKSS
ncbi:MAG: hypothetical protein KDH94_03540 [Coxiellaceae bacterium]|nr:hypothetical protein [Coxiellaceae bacterium]